LLVYSKSLELNENNKDLGLFIIGGKIIYPLAPYKINKLKLKAASLERRY
jgi:hypothetical protein